MTTTLGIISADSHVIEPPNCYIDYIDPKFRELAPRVVRTDGGWDEFRIPGVPGGVKFGILEAAAVKPADFKRETKFGIHPAAHNAALRPEVQRQDGVDAEIIFASVGMHVSSKVGDPELRRIYFQAYNRWLADYCAGAPGRLFGLSLTGFNTAEDTVEDVIWAHEQGFAGIMMPGDSGGVDYDDSEWDAVWDAASSLRMPLAFHISTSKSTPLEQQSAIKRGSEVSKYMVMPRSIQDTLSVFVLGGVLERYPSLRLVAAESDVSWIPHWKFRMDKAYTTYRSAVKSVDLPRLPSEYIDRQVFATFQNDWIAFSQVGVMPLDRIMWASDYPHSDSTWPGSPEFLREHTSDLTGEQRAAILRNNVIKCYDLPLPLAEGDVFLRADGLPYEKATGRPLHGATALPVS